MPAVSLIVHLEGGRERARRCLEALAGLAAEPSFEAILVDDASPDLAELLGGLSGDVKVLSNERHEGFVASAIKAAAVAESEVLVLIRDAALLDPDALRHLVAVLDDEETSGATPGGSHPTSTLALAMRRADAGCLSATAGAAPGFELAAVCAELSRRGAVVAV